MRVFLLAGKNQHLGPLKADVTGDLIAMGLRVEPQWVRVVASEADRLRGLRILPGDLVAYGPDIDFTTEFNVHLDMIGIHAAWVKHYA